MLVHPDVAEAVDWLCAAFGFRERVRIGAHRAQLSLGDDAVVMAAGGVWTFSQSIADVAPEDWGGLSR